MAKKTAQTQPQLVKGESSWKWDLGKVVGIEGIVDGLEYSGAIGAAGDLLSEGFAETIAFLGDYSGFWDPSMGKAIVSHPTTMAIREFKKDIIPFMIQYWAGRRCFRAREGEERTGSQRVGEYLTKSLACGKGLYDLIGYFGNSLNARVPISVGGGVAAPIIAKGLARLRKKK